MLTFCLAFYLAFSLASVRVQACPTASGAGDMLFGGRGGGRRRKWGGVAPLLKSRDPHLIGRWGNRMVFRGFMVLNWALNRWSYCSSHAWGIPVFPTFRDTQVGFHESSQVTCHDRIIVHCHKRCIQWSTKIVRIVLSSSELQPN